jgi:hypothetical protein
MCMPSVHALQCTAVRLAALLQGTLVMVMDRLDSQRLTAAQLQVAGVLPALAALLLPPATQPAVNLTERVVAHGPGGAAEAEAAEGIPGGWAEAGGVLESAAEVEAAGGAVSEATLVLTLEALCAVLNGLEDSGMHPHAGEEGEDYLQQLLACVPGIMSVLRCAPCCQAGQACRGPAVPACVRPAQGCQPGGGASCVEPPASDPRSAVGRCPPGLPGGPHAAAARSASSKLPLTVALHCAAGLCTRPGGGGGGAAAGCWPGHGVPPCCTGVGGGAGGAALPCASALKQPWSKPPSPASPVHVCAGPPPQGGCRQPRRVLQLLQPPCAWTHGDGGQPCRQPADSTAGLPNMSTICTALNPPGGSVPWAAQLLH